LILLITFRTYQSSFAQNDELLILSAWIGDKVGIRFRSSKPKKTEWTSLDMEREVHSAINSYLVQLSFHYSKQYYVKLDHKELLFSFFSQTTFSMIVLWPQIKLLHVCVWRINLSWKTEHVQAICFPSSRRKISQNMLQHKLTPSLHIP
jgi:hypothetical protein